jgi:hypothetical protein
MTMCPARAVDGTPTVVLLNAPEHARARRFSFQPCKSMTDDRLMLLMFIASATVAAGALVTLLWLHL